MFGCVLSLHNVSALNPASIDRGSSGRDVTSSKVTALVWMPTAYRVSERLFLLAALRSVTDWNALHNLTLVTSVFIFYFSGQLHLCRLFLQNIIYIWYWTIKARVDLIWVSTWLYFDCDDEFFEMCWPDNCEFLWHLWASRTLLGCHVFFSRRDSVDDRAWHSRYYSPNSLLIAERICALPSASLNVWVWYVSFLVDRSQLSDKIYQCLSYEFLWKSIEFLLYDILSNHLCKSNSSLLLQARVWIWAWRTSCLPPFAIRAAVGNHHAILRRPTQVRIELSHSIVFHSHYFF